MAKYTPSPWSSGDVDATRRIPSSKIKTLRIHHEHGDEEYEVFDRHGTFRKTFDEAIKIENPPRVLYFGYCPIDTFDVTLEFETPLDANQIKLNPC